MVFDQTRGGVTQNQTLIAKIKIKKLKLKKIKHTQFIKKLLYQVDEKKFQAFSTPLTHHHPPPLPLNPSQDILVL